jgi:hypothetical protein
MIRSKVCGSDHKVMPTIAEDSQWCNFVEKGHIWKHSLNIHWLLVLYMLLSLERTHLNLTYLSIQFHHFRIYIRVCQGTAQIMGANPVTLQFLGTQWAWYDSHCVLRSVLSLFGISPSLILPLRRLSYSHRPPLINHITRDIQLRNRGPMHAIERPT